MSSVAQKLYNRVTNLSFAFVLALSSLTALAPFIFAQNATALPGAGTVVVTGNTSPGENSEGWMFNRDTTTATPFEFNNDEAVLGDGSLYVLPIGAGNASDKFIAENFVLSPIADINSVSYDFKIGGGGSASDANEFYMNVYANFGSSPDDKYYDCRYNVVPAGGSTGSFTTVTFDPNQTYAVTTRGGASASPYVCPASPADMDGFSAGSTIRMFALNLGDESANDVGVDGYFDNVVLNTSAGVTTYDFEAALLAAPTLTAPASGAAFTTADLPQTQSWSTVPGTTHYLYESYTQDPLADDTPFYSQTRTTTSWTIGVTAPEGEYWWRVKAVAPYASEWSDARTFTVDNTAPAMPTLSSPSNNAIVKGASVTQAWASTDTDIDYYIYESYHNSTATSLRWHQEVNGTSKTATNVANTEYWWRVKAVDNAGNESAWSELWKLIVDNDAPDVEITNPLGGSVGGTVDIRGTVTDANPHHYYLKIERQTGPSSWTNVYSHTYAETSSFTDQSIYSWTPSIEGTYRITLEARDAAGGTSSSGNKDSGSVDQVTVVIDNTAPDTTITDSTQTTNTPTITGTVDDVAATVTLTVVGVGTFTLTPDALGNWSQTVGPLVDGSYNVEVYATDQAGNVGATDTALLTVDTTPAVVPGGDGDGEVEGETDEDDTEGQPIANITPIIVPPSANGDEDVQGATDENDDQDVEGTNTENVAQVDTDASDGSVFGLAWYWWIVILAALTALVWGIIAALRRRQEEA